MLIRWSILNGKLNITLLSCLQFGLQARMLEPWLYHENAAVRHMAARVLGALAVALPVTTLTQLVEAVVPKLASIQCEVQRRGAAEAIHCVIQKLGFDVVPYSVMLVVPLLGEYNNDVYFSSSCFFMAKMEFL